MSKKKLTDISKIKDEKVVLTNQSANLKNHPKLILNIYGNAMYVVLMV